MKNKTRTIHSTCKITSLSWKLRTLNFLYIHVLTYLILKNKYQCFEEKKWKNKCSSLEHLTICTLSHASRECRQIVLCWAKQVDLNKCIFLHCLFNTCVHAIELDTNNRTRARTPHAVGVLVLCQHGRAAAITNRAKYTPNVIAAGQGRASQVHAYRFCQRR